MAETKHPASRTPRASRELNTPDEKPLIITQMLYKILMQSVGLSTRRWKIVCESALYLYCEGAAARRRGKLWQSFFSARRRGAGSVGRGVLAGSWIFFLGAGAVWKEVLSIYKVRVVLLYPEGTRRTECQRRSTTSAPQVLKAKHKGR